MYDVMYVHTINRYSTPVESDNIISSAAHTHTGVCIAECTALLCMLTMQSN